VQQLLYGAWYTKKDQWEPDSQKQQYQQDKSGKQNAAEVTNQKKTQLEETKHQPALK
jgi:hypothetical protein